MEDYKEREGYAILNKKEKGFLNSLNKERKKLEKKYPEGQLDSAIKNSTYGDDFISGKRDEIYTLMNSGQYDEAKELADKSFSTFNSGHTFTDKIKTLASKEGRKRFFADRKIKNTMKQSVDDVKQSSENLGCINFNEASAIESALAVKIDKKDPNFNIAETVEANYEVLSYSSNNSKGYNPLPAKNLEKIRGLGGEEQKPVVKKDLDPKSADKMLSSKRDM